MHRVSRTIISFRMEFMTKCWSPLLELSTPIHKSKWWDWGLGGQGNVGRMSLKIMLNMVGWLLDDGLLFLFFRITVDLNAGHDFAFHFNPRFNEDGHKVIVRNSCIGDKWGKEEREISNFPFVPGQRFEVWYLSHLHFQIHFGPAARGRVWCFCFTVSQLL